MRFFSFILDIIAPKKCYSCKKEWYFLCFSCLKNIPWFMSHCHICKKDSNDFEIHKGCKNIKNNKVYYDKILIFKHYKNKYIKKSIHDAKFYGKKEIFNEFWNWLAFYFLSQICIQDKSKYVILYPPMSFIKKLIRWYNQAEILAKSISKNTGILIAWDVLFKKKNTRQQSHLSKKERMINLIDSFKINKKALDKIDKKIIIFVDDVISTGSTCNEVSRVLKWYWAQEIIGLFIASD